MAQFWLFFAVKNGLDPEALCSTAGIRLSDIADRDSQIPHEWFARLRAAIIEQLPGVAVGLDLGTFASPDQLGYAGQAFKYCAAPLDVLMLLVRTCALMDSAFREDPIALRAEKETLELRVPIHPGADPPECIEAVFVSQITLLRGALGERIAPRQVSFAHPREASLQQRFRDFFGAEVRFGNAHDAMVFERSVLERPIAGADPIALRNFGVQIDRLLNELDEPFVSAVARAVEACLARGDLSQERVARSLGTSTRSLQRRLKEGSATYSGVVAATRKSVAMRLLRDRGLAIYDVAFALGYDDVRSFHRFFARCAGVTPKAYRDRDHETPMDKSAPVAAVGE